MKTRLQLFKQAITYNPKLAAAYLRMLEELGLHEKITIGNRTYDRKALCLEAVHNDITNASAFATLACELPRQESVTISHPKFHAKKLDARALFLESLQLDPHLSKAYDGLAWRLEPGETVELPDGRKMTAKQLFCEAVIQDPTNARACSDLGSHLDVGEVMVMPDGRRLDRQQLQLEALRLDPSEPNGYILLGAERGLAVCDIPDGRSLTKRELLLEGVHHSAQSSRAFSVAVALLCADMERAENVTLMSGHELDKKQLCLHAIHRDVSDVAAYHTLGGLLSAGELCIEF